MVVWQLATIAALIGALLIYVMVLTNRLGATNVLLKRIEEGLVRPQPVSENLPAREAEIVPVRAPVPMKRTAVEQTAPAAQAEEASADEAHERDRRVSYLTVRDLKVIARSGRRSSDTPVGVSPLFNEVFGRKHAQAERAEALVESAAEAASHFEVVAVDEPMMASVDTPAVVEDLPTPTDPATFDRATSESMPFERVTTKPTAFERTTPRSAAFESESTEAVGFERAMSMAATFERVSTEAVAFERTSGGAAAFERVSTEPVAFMRAFEPVTPEAVTPESAAESAPVSPLEAAVYTAEPPPPSPDITAANEDQAPAEAAAEAPAAAAATNAAATKSEPDDAAAREEKRKRDLLMHAYRRRRSR